MALTGPDAGRAAPVRIDGEIFDLTLEQLAEPQMYQQARGKEAAEGAQELVPYFYTKGTKAKPSAPTKTTLQLLEQIEAAKTRELWRFLVALSIRHVGPSAARETWLRVFRSFEAIRMTRRPRSSRPSRAWARRSRTPWSSGSPWTGTGRSSNAGSPPGCARACRSRTRTRRVR